MFLRFRITSELPTLLLVIDRERLSEALSGETGAEEFSSVTIESPQAIRRESSSACNCAGSIE